MIVFRGNTAWFDVDDTLIMWSPSKEDLETKGIDITCPKGVWLNPDGELVASDTWTQRVVPHRLHMKQMITHKSRGHKIVVWSAGGEDWAEAAVKALGLEDYVDIVIGKPDWIYDDKAPEEFMPKAKWYKDE